MSEIVEVPRWIMIGVAAPLIVAAAVGSGGSVATLIALNNTVNQVEATLDNIQESSPTTLYVDNSIDRLKGQLSSNIKFLQYQIDQSLKNIQKNSMRSEKNHDDIMNIKSRIDKKNAIWSPPMPSPKTHLVWTSVIHDKRSGF